MIAAIKQLKKNSDIMITKPAKGNGTVIINKSDYKRKILDILNNPVNFQELNVDLYKQIMKLERRNNRLVDKMISEGIVTSLVGNKLKSRGSRPGILYGLPKIHKKRCSYETCFVYDRLI